MVITLHGKTKKGRERIARDGATGWKVREKAEHVAFSPRRGPWLLIEKNTSCALRWIHRHDDPHFAVEE